MVPLKEAMAVATAQMRKANPLGAAVPMPATAALLRAAAMAASASSAAAPWVPVPGGGMQAPAAVEPASEAEELAVRPVVWAA